MNDSTAADQADSNSDASATGPKKSSLLVIFLTVFIDLLGFGMVLPLLPIYAKDFLSDVPEGQIGLILGLLMASFSAMQFIFAPLWGRLSDRIGRRPVLMIGLASSVVFYTLFGIGTVYKSIWILFVARIGAGIAGATISTAQAYIADSTTLENRPKGMALIGVAFGLGFTFGPLLGYLAVPSGVGDPGPWPGYAAAILSAFALGLAIFKLPESLRPDSESAVTKKFSIQGLKDTLATPSVMLVLITIFVCIFSFANFETTISLLLKGKDGGDSPYHFTFGQVCLTYAYIGLTLVIVQGGIVRRLAGKIPEGTMAAGGALIEVLGFGLLIWGTLTESVTLLMIALPVITSGFAFMSPSLNSLLSRRSDPAKQGSILGIGQSVNSMARILGPMIGMPLFHIHPIIPFTVAATLMGVGFVLVIVASRSGKDFVAENKS
ncbi:MAG: MFS transporter [Blastopirellula sp.]|nr:MAG: MFS transporter [Blastopirellula sp.]